MMMLPTVQAVTQESLAPVAPQIIAQQGPELLQKYRPIEKRESFNIIGGHKLLLILDSSSLSPRSFEMPDQRRILHRTK